MSTKLLKEYISSIVNELALPNNTNAHVEIYELGDHTRSDQPLFQETSKIAEFDFDPEQGDFYEDFVLNGIDLPDEGWRKVSDAEWNLVIDGEIIYVAEITFKG